MAVPEATGETSPVALSIVATAILLLLQVPQIIESLKWTAEPKHIVTGPRIGVVAIFTVTALESVAVHAPIVLVAVMTLVVVAATSAGL